jgi:translation initiation factor eIF-2B subunit delta
MITKRYKEEFTQFANDSVHGAVYLTLQALKVLKNEVGRNDSLTLKDLTTMLHSLASAHKEIISIKNTIEQLEDKITAKSFNQQEIQSLITAVEQAVKEKEEQTVTNAVERLSQYQLFMTLSRSSTILKVFKKLISKNSIKEIFVLESRPLFEGRKQAKALAELGVPVKQIVDAAAGFYAEQIEAIIIGADMILKDGSVINKIGSFLLALAADFYQKPFYVVASSNKQTTISPKNYRKHIIERASEELEAPAKENIEARNIYFEYVPAKLITAIISEK